MLLRISDTSDSHFRSKLNPVCIPTTYFGTSTITCKWRRTRYQPSYYMKLLLFSLSLLCSVSYKTFSLKFESIKKGLRGVLTMRNRWVAFENTIFRNFISPWYPFYRSINRTWFFVVLLYHSRRILVKVKWCRKEGGSIYILFYR